MVDDHILKFPKDFKHRTRTSSCFSFGCGDRVAKGHGHCVVIVFYHNELFLLSLRDHVQILTATHIIFWSQGDSSVRVRLFQVIPRFTTSI